ncbi:hypothetical protein N866_03190 [Actinotalea ferrariae CF5-4]|uniref:Uncharacterized protein n=1 Tax=Actinotalea ferrariae CF5-4 TaxID=948458 RepID=A0A021VXZ6_9CELL|nr:hypothetical protein [Actinotalea ferrariae]EYR64865.1 hypothetical protein N866_03190 [Actinotalea ferrariae CF5-4]
MDHLTDDTRGAFRVTTARSTYTLNLTARTLTREGDQVLADNDMFVLAQVEVVKVGEKMQVVVLHDGQYRRITSSVVQFIAPVVVLPAA